MKREPCFMRCSLSVWLSSIGTLQRPLLRILACFEGGLLMRTALQTGSLLLIGLTVIGCGNGGPQGKIDPTLPVVSIKIDGMT
jgi:hypothetical protein